MADHRSAPKPPIARRLPPDRKDVSEIFVDESSQTQHRFLALGALIVPQTSLNAFEASIRAARLPELPLGEMKWTKVSRSKLPAYKRVVDAFFAASEITHRIEFHSLYVDTSLIRDSLFNEGSREIGFNKEIFQIVKKCADLHRTRLLHVYLDQRNTSSTTEKLRFILNSHFKKKGDKRDWPFRRIHFRGRLEKDSTGRRFVIQAWDVDRTEPWPDGRHCQEDQALPV
jgi:hypothetical protein